MQIVQFHIAYKILHKSFKAVELLSLYPSEPLPSPSLLHPISNLNSLSSQLRGELAGS